jgi:8-oxo-dGTP pyrophosphatase MutT (NUDIX family)
MISSNPNHPMKHYVLGFMFDCTLQKVVLIKKDTDKPEQQWQNGLLNGVGGGIERDELPKAAMSREFFEETGLPTADDDWLFAGRITDGFHYSVNVYLHCDYSVDVLETAALQPGEKEVPSVYYVPLVKNGWYNLANDVKELVINCLWVLDNLKNEKVREFHFITD